MKPLRISLAERRRGLAISTVEGMSAQSHSALTGLGTGANALTIGFGLLLGARDLELGLIAAVPPLAGLFQLVAAAMTARMSSRRIAVAVASTVARVLWLACGLLPFVLARDHALAAFLVLWMLSSALVAVSGNWWVSWIADLCPPRARARYFALRSAAATAAGLAVGLVGGLALDRWFGGVPRVSLDGDDPAFALRAEGFAWAFGAAALLGVACGWLLWRQPEPRHRVGAPAGPRGSPWSFLAQTITAGWRTRGFAGLLVFVACFGLANGLAVPYWQPFQLKELGLSYTYVNGVLVTLGGVAAIAALPLWGALAARWGHRAVMIVSLAIISTHPAYFLIATPDRIWPMLLDAASSGFAWSGFNLAMFNLVLALAHGPERDRLVALHTAVAGLAQAASSVFAGRLTDWLPAALELGGVELGARQQIFAMTGLARLGCLVLFCLVVTRPRAQAAPGDFAVAMVRPSPGRWGAFTRALTVRFRRR